MSYEKPIKEEEEEEEELTGDASPAAQRNYQLTVNNTVWKEKKSSGRPRGRPPNPNTTRKRRAALPTLRPVKAKRTCNRRTYQKRSKITKNVAPVAVTKKARMSSSSSEDEDETETGSLPDVDLEKRSMHNNMERLRRVDLRNLFDNLRMLVPEIQHKDKAPKVTILRQSGVYCDKIMDLEQNLTTKVKHLKKHQERLMLRLNALREELAIQR